MARPEDHGDLQLSGVLNIENSTKIALLLYEAVEKYDNLAIDVSGLKELDLPGIQLLYSACRTASAKGKTVSLTGSIDPDAIRKLLHAGFIQNICSSGEALAAMLPDFKMAGNKNAG